MTTVEAAAGQGPPGTTAEEDGRVVEDSVADGELFTLIFDRYGEQVHAYLARRVGPDVAEDLTAETFFIAFRQRSRFDSHVGVVRAWLFGIATNLLRRHRRTETRRWRAMAKLPPPEIYGELEERAATQLTAQASRPRLAAALARLAPRDREAFLLVAFGDLTYDEAAKALGIAHGTVCSRIARARRRIRESLDHTDPRSVQ
ncbi:RNA polymerase sigma factor [Kribbella albertanoniae]|uniref:RNA polymerase sigma factor n=1 Tax=Kribbella albertanoniae TaxID=1266829 RepID=A0A4R4QA51_9ACTN|nr:RNA polymerase sigma factor [Kribbella albertanoniae]TDC32188.1 RNA polymerase sigma factor [Kribbella albertanoniae]